MVYVAITEKGDYIDWFFGVDLDFGLYVLQEVKKKKIGPLWNSKTTILKVSSTLLEIIWELGTYTSIGQLVRYVNMSVLL